MTIALIGAMFTIFGGVLASSALRARGQYETEAVALAEGELSAALALPAAELTDRSGSPFVGYTEKRGLWRVESQPNAASAPNVFAVATSSPAIYGTTAAARLPFGPIVNGSFSVSLYVPANPPGGWRGGILFRSRDLGNGYRYTIGATNLLVEKLVNGTATTLYSQAVGLAPGTWVNLGVTLNNDSLTILKNGTSLTTITDSAWAYGDLALAVTGGARIFFDNAATSGDQAATWNFDADPVGLAAADWRDFGVADLPNGSGSITIDHPGTGGSLARVTTRVVWATAKGQKTITVTGYK